MDGEQLDDKHQRKSARGAAPAGKHQHQPERPATIADGVVPDEPAAGLQQLMSGGDEHRKQNHCEIEKRRRDKMNHFIMELASVIPSFANSQSKFDKLTVLRMAVQHVKSLRTSLCSFSSYHLRPSFLSSGNLLKNLILQMASQEAQDNLFMVVTCDSGKVLFVSESSKDILNQDQHELVGQCLFDILHKDDVSKVKEQISHFSLGPKEMLVDSKTLQPIRHNQRPSFNQLQSQSSSTPQPGARRSFFCRMKSGRNGQPASPNKQPAATGPAPAAGASPAAPADSMKLLAAIKSTGRHVGVAYVGAGGPNIDRPVKSIGGRASTARFASLPAPLPGFLVSKDSAGSLSSGIGSWASTCSSSSGNCKYQPTVRANHNAKRVSHLHSRGIKADHANSSANRSRVSLAENNTRAGGSDGASVGSSISSSSSSSRISISSSSSSSSGSSSGSSSCSRSGIVSGNSQSHRALSSNESPPIDKVARDIKRGHANFKKSSPSESSSSKKHWRYIVMHCTGYLKSVTLRNDEFDDEDFDDYNSEYNSSDDEENDNCKTIKCLVAVCRRSPVDRDLKPDRPLTFTCRYSMEGKFMFVDKRTTVALGYTPQQLLGTSHYAYCHKDSVNTFKECHRQSILKSEPVSSDIYQFKRANGQHLWLQTSLKSFRNPWTKFIDYIVANHTTAEGNEPHYNEGCVPTKFNQDMTGDASQMSSPASSSSISLQSMDSKKSSSPSSSSIGSSYSLDSCASSGSIQALLHQIDRVKSGGVSGGSVYSSNSSLQGGPVERGQLGTALKDSRSPEVCAPTAQEQTCQPLDKLPRQPPYVMQPIGSAPMNMVPGLAPMNMAPGPAPMNIMAGPVSMQNEVINMEGQVNEIYPAELMPVTPYTSQEVNTRPYNGGFGLDQMQQITGDLQPSVNMTLQQHLQQTQAQRSQQSTMSIPMIWNSAEPTPYQNMSTVNNTEAGQICTGGDVAPMSMDLGNPNDQLIAPQMLVHCQQCTNHKCSNQQLMMTNNTELNSINLTSLAVDGDLDEDQLIEYLADCDPETQLYNIQNNTFPQYNIYR